jgi:hypothetical protein
MAHWYNVFWHDEAVKDAEFTAGGFFIKVLWDKWKNRARKITEVPHTGKGIRMEIKRKKRWWQ